MRLKMPKFDTKYSNFDRLLSRWPSKRGYREKDDESPMMRGFTIASSPAKEALLYFPWFCQLAARCHAFEMRYLAHTAARRYHAWRLAFSRAAAHVWHVTMLATYISDARELLSSGGESRRHRTADDAPGAFQAASPSGFIFQLLGCLLSFHISPYMAPGAICVGYFQSIWWLFLSIEIATKPITCFSHALLT